MRVITGEYRGRKLETPENYDVRPTSDKVKEAVFNLLMNDTYDAVFCDLFAGTGSLGIEALSRGARLCYFGDNSRDSIRMIHHNLTHVGAEKKAVVIPGDYKKVLNRLNEKIDVFLIDPPYRAGLYENCLEQIDTLDLLAPDGIILTEHDSRTPMPENVGGFVLDRVRKYGKTSVSIYRRKAEENVEGGAGAEE